MKGFWSTRNWDTGIHLRYGDSTTEYGWALTALTEIGVVPPEVPRCTGDKCYQSKIWWLMFSLLKGFSVLKLPGLLWIATTNSREGFEPITSLSDGFCWYLSWLAGWLAPPFLTIEIHQMEDAPFLRSPVIHEIHWYLMRLGFSKWTRAIFMFPSGMRRGLWANHHQLLNPFFGCQKEWKSVFFDVPKDFPMRIMKISQENITVQYPSIPPKKCS